MIDNTVKYLMLGEFYWYLEQFPPNTSWLSNLNTIHTFQQTWSFPIIFTILILPKYRLLLVVVISFVNKMFQWKFMKMFEHIEMKCYGGILGCIMKNWLNFGGNQKTHTA